MNVFFNLLLLGILLLFCNISNAVEQIAFVAGRAPYDRLKEGKNLSFITSDIWRFDFFDNRQIADLSANLGKYKMVVFGSLYNFVQPVSFTSHANIWHNYVNDGVIIVVLTACEQSASAELLKVLFKQPGVIASQTCSLLGRFDLNSRIEYSNHEMLFRPMNLEQKFTESNFYYWGHMIVSEEWLNLISCPDGKSLFAIRPLGKGWVVLVSHPEFTTRSQLLKNILQNIQIFVRNHQSGLSWKNWEIDPNKEEFVITLKNISQQPVFLKGRQIQVIDENKKLELPFEKSIAPKAICRITAKSIFPAGSKGKIQLDIESPAQWQAEVNIAKAQPLSVLPAWRRIFRHQTSAFPMNIKVVHSTGMPTKLKTQFRLIPQAPMKVISASDTQVLLDLTNLKSGEYTLIPQLIKPDGTVYFQAESEKIIVDDNIPYNKVDKKNKIRRGKEAFFPLGFYHVSWNLPPENRIECMEFSVKYGYNTIHVSWGKEEELDTVVALAKKLNLALFIEGASPARLTRWKDEKAILGWSLRDEPDLRLENPIKLAEEYEFWRKLTPNHLISTVLVYPKSFGMYKRIGDMIGHDYYPIFAAKRDIRKVYDYHKQLRQEIGPWRAPIAVLQCFGYKSGFSKPTPKEVRNMVYQAILADTAGIFFYTYNDSVFVLKDNPDLYQLMQKLPKEILPLTKFLLEGKQIMLPNTNESIIAAEWLLGEQRLEIICNASYQEQNVKIADRQLKLKPLDVSVKIETQKLYKNSEIGITK